MKINVLYFQSVRRAVGRDQEALDLPAGARVGDALAAILARHPSIEPLVPSLAFAVNREIAARSATLSASDELALLPPFSGG